MRIIRIAYFSPTPPGASGINDYGLGVLEQLTHRMDVDIYTNVTAPTPLADWTLLPYDLYPAMAARAPYDLNIYAIGNSSELYDDIFDLALREPGLVILQDLTLYDFYSGRGRRTPPAPRR